MASTLAVTTLMAPLVKRILTLVATIVAKVVKEAGADIPGMPEAWDEVVEEAGADIPGLPEAWVEVVAPIGVEAEAVAVVEVETSPENLGRFTLSTRAWWKWRICRSIFP